MFRSIGMYQGFAVGIFEVASDLLGVLRFNWSDCGPYRCTNARTSASTHARLEERRCDARSAAERDCERAEVVVMYRGGFSKRRGWEIWRNGRSFCRAPAEGAFRTWRVVKRSIRGQIERA
jgi:hypothetical protein